MNFPSRPSWHPAVASVCTMLVIALAALVASPTLHAWMHGDGAPHSDVTCPVNHFAGGLAMAEDSAALESLPLLGLPESWALPAAPAVAQPRFLRLPERGPPLA